MSIGTNIYTLRKEKKLTQCQLAEKLGVSEQAVSKWENGQCSPDVSLFPVIADFFGVSIDRLFGYHMNSYADKVKEIIKAADDSMDTYKEIEIISAGLEKYPNSPDLKMYLAFSLSMVNRISDDEKERKSAIEKAIKFCREVVDTCGDQKKTDSALNMLARIYNETGDYEKAEEVISKLSADAYSSRITGTVTLLGHKGSFKEQERYAKESLWNMYWTMSHIFETLTHAFSQNGESEKAVAFYKAHEKLLSVFDEGCGDFCATYKIFACESKAREYMKLGNRRKCLETLRHFFELAKQVENVAQSPDFNIAVRNPLYFSGIEEDIQEEYMSGMFPERVLPKYDLFFGDDEKYAKFKRDFSL